VDREEILRRFEAWLDRVLAAEEPRLGIEAELLSSLLSGAEISPEGQCDLYAMWAAVTSLTQEVKLQGRSFKELSGALVPLADLVPQLPGMQREAQERARREVLNALLDLRDRLRRGLETTHASQAKMQEALRSNWQGRLLARHPLLRQASEGTAALVEGFRMSLEHLDEVLARFGVREIDCQGQPFDPHTMDVVEVEETNQAAEGTVVEVYRAGYEWKGEVHRPAQVKVARKPTSMQPKDNEDE
jgi:molecular chaperone GrpE